jgi:MYXO-CTERM domain-containing protein
MRPRAINARAMSEFEPEWLLFAGNATWGVIWGIILLALAAFAMWRDRRRNKRTRPEDVGCLPWMTVSVVLLLAAAAAFLFALKSH